MGWYGANINQVAVFCRSPPSIYWWMFKHPDHLIRGALGYLCMRFLHCAHSVKISGKTEMFLPDRNSPKPFNVCICENGVYRVQFILVCFSRIRIPLKGCNFAAFITMWIDAKNIGKSVIWGLINLYEHGIDKLLKYAAVAELVDAQRWGRCGVNTPWKFESSQPHH